MPGDTQNSKIINTPIGISWAYAAKTSPLSRDKSLPLPTTSGSSFRKRHPTESTELGLAQILRE